MSSINYLSKTTLVFSCYDNLKKNSLELANLPWTKNMSLYLFNVKTNFKKVKCASKDLTGYLKSKSIYFKQKSFKQLTKN